MKYWEFTEETKVSTSGEKLRRIICTQDFLHAKKGDLGGWLGENAVLKDNAWIADEAQVFFSAEVCGNARVSGNAIVRGNAKVCEDASVWGNAKVFGNAIVRGNAKVFDDANNNNIGHKEIDGKLPMYTVLFKQFPNAFKIVEDVVVDGSDFSNYRKSFNFISKGEIEKSLCYLFCYLNDKDIWSKGYKSIAKCSVLGHEKYKEHDEDWQNFSRVPDAYDHYLNAAVRHLLEGDKINEEDSTDAIKVNHLEQALWNLMAAIEVKARVETVK